MKKLSATHTADGRRIWKCSNCGHTDTWGSSWSWHGALADRVTGIEPAVELIACSEECKAALHKAALQ